jgi:hypothetical protein
VLRERREGAGDLQRQPLILSGREWLSDRGRIDRSTQLN